MYFSQAEKRKLNKLHSDVLRRFTYKTDQQKWGAPEFWEDDSAVKAAASSNITFSGDCEETARVFMLLARAAGFHARLVIGRDETGAGHCWCEVSSIDYSDAIHLCNRKSAPLAFHRLGYHPYDASPWNPVPGDARPWVRLVRS